MTQKKTKNEEDGGISGKVGEDRRRRFVIECKKRGFDITNGLKLAIDFWIENKKKK